MTKRVALICGKPAKGKSTSLRNMDNALHVNCEGSAKELSFSLKNKKAFKSVTLEEPTQLTEVFEYAKENPQYHTIVIDGLNLLAEMFESKFVLTQVDTRSAWGDYAQFLKYIMQTLVATCDKNIIFISHVEDIHDKNNMITQQKVPIKGSVGKTGIEAYFSTILQADVVPIETLENIQNDLLTITDDEKEEGFKYVFQTKITKDTLGSNIRTPIGLFDKSELYIDSDVVKVIERLNEYYE